MTNKTKALLSIFAPIIAFIIVLGLWGMFKSTSAGDYLDQQLKIESQIQKLTLEKQELQKRRDKLVAEARTGFIQNQHQ